MKNVHLSISVIVVVTAGLAYGFNPELILPKLFQFEVENTTLKNIFRAVMGLYLALAGYWMLGIQNKTHWKGATTSNLVFMLGLGLGRTISWIIDGSPTIHFQIGLFLELAFALWAYLNLKTYTNKNSNT